MEGVAWATHKFLMHGALWNLHKDHHDGGYHPFQKNDSFFLIFALPSWLFIQIGWMNEIWWMAGVGTGILLYGLCYFLVHDVIIHRRFRWFDSFDGHYIRVMRWAHKMHHKHRDKDAGESFGLLIVPARYWKKVKDDEARRQEPKYSAS